MIFNIHLVYNTASIKSVLLLSNIIMRNCISGISFSSLGSQLRWSPVPQKLLYDSDDDSCERVPTSHFTDVGASLVLVMYWDPSARNIENTQAATHHCQTSFYVNLTHSVNVHVSVFKRVGVLTSNDISNGVLSFDGCPLIGQTEVNGKVRSKFGSCHCDSKCTVIIRVSGESNPLICTLMVYD